MGWGRGRQEQPWNRKLRRLKPQRTPPATAEQAAMADMSAAARERETNAVKQEYLMRRQHVLVPKVLGKQKVAERLERQMQKLKGGGRGGSNINQPRDAQGRWT